MAGSLGSRRGVGQLHPIETNHLGGSASGSASASASARRQGDPPSLSPLRLDIDVPSTDSLLSPASAQSFLSLQHSHPPFPRESPAREPSPAAPYAGYTRSPLSQPARSPTGHDYTHSLLVASPTTPSSPAFPSRPPTVPFSILSPHAASSPPERPAVVPPKDGDTVWEGPATGPSTSGSPSRARSGELSSSTSSIKKANPLQDLIRTERLYVDDLSVIIKKVAAAWSRANFPPPALDTMFRAIEAVYRINKSLLSKLEDIGPSPASPKALGDLLMRWVTDLTPAYQRYTSSLQMDFDHFVPVQSNLKLASILATLSYPSSLLDASPDIPVASHTTLDVLFRLPRTRLGYYKRLYAKLLRSTQAGRSDHAMLLAANESLDRLLAGCEEGKSRSLLAVANGGARSSAGSQSEGQGSNRRSDRFSSTTGTSLATSATLLSGPPRIEDLERRLSTDRALDIFTMQPKKCKLQMAPPSLPFVRQIRRAGEVYLSFTPLSSPSQTEAITPRAYIFLLTDLFLVCTRMTPSEQVAAGEGRDMWLLYPPLAGKHLKVESGRDDRELVVVVMRKERLVLRCEDREDTEAWRLAFEDAIAFGAAQGVAPRSPVPASPSASSGSVPSRQLSRSTTPSQLSATSSGARPSSIPGDFGPPLRQPREASPSMVPPPRKQSMPLPPTPKEDVFDRRPQSRSITPGERSRSLTPNEGYPPPQEGASPMLPGGYPRSPQPPFSATHQQYQYQQHQYQHYQQPQPTYPDHGSGSYESPLALPPSNPHEPESFLPPQPPYQHAASFTPSLAHLQKNDSTRSAGSVTSSFRTDRSSPYPDPSPPPPPLPRSSYGSGSYSSTLPTSRRTDPGATAGTQSGGLLTPHTSIHRSQSAEGLRDGHYRMPSETFVAGSSSRGSSAPGSLDEESPPPSPTVLAGPTKTVVAASMRCKAFLQQHHAQWKSLGTARLKLFVSTPGNTKQIVVESDKSDKKTFVSTIVLTDGVERVGKVGVAIELSDQGNRTGIIYMLQMKTEQSATGLFEQLLLGSDREVRH